MNTNPLGSSIRSAMTSRERIRAIVAGATPDRCGAWMGDPHPDTWPIYLNYFGTTDAETVRKCLGDDLRWLCPQGTCYRHPEGRPLWDNGHDLAQGLASTGMLADCEDPREVDKVAWPNLDYCDFSQTLHALRNAGPHYRVSGMWCCFFHDVADFFGMENYFMKMVSDPEVVDAVTERVCDFYLRANERFFAAAGDEIDAFFFGNDFGTQRGLFLSPQMFDRFLLPWIRKFAEQARAHGYQVWAHSCGSVAPLIDRFIDAGVQALHPLQAKAVGMDAVSLAARYKGRVAFVGGIDTQHLLVHGSPADIQDEVRRVRDLLGPQWVISPSHECILPNVPPANIEAMMKEAVK